MPERTPEQIGREPLALRNLRTTLRVAAEDLRDLEARIKYGATDQTDAFRDAHEVWTALGLELNDANADRDDL